MSIERAQEIIRDRGSGLRADDLREIELEIATAPVEAAHEARPWLLEGVALIVNDPEYTGDIPPM